nr:Uncharacterized oxidoreductase yhhX [Klebsiella pneumoniae]
MTLHCAFIGFGKSTTRYHLPYVLHRKDRWQVAHIYRRRAKPEEQAPQYSHIHFTSDLEEVLNDPLVKLVVVCTHADSHFEYAKKALEAGKTCWWKSRSPRRWRKQNSVCPGEQQRSDGDALSEPPFRLLLPDHQKVIESGKLGELVEIESHFDNYRPLAETNPAVRKTASSMALACIPDQIISLFGRPDHVSYDLRSLRNKANPDDTFEAQLFYGDMKAIVKTSHLVQIDYPKFIVHGHKGSFVKYGIDQQETSLKANVMPGEPGFGADDSVGELVYVNEAGEMVREAVPLESGDYGRVYDALYDTLVNGQPNYVKETDVLTNMEILQRGFEQPSPATITLTR